MNKRDGQAFFQLLPKLNQKLTDSKTEAPTILVAPVTLHLLEVFRKNFQWF
jgi:hypothetical protein